MSNVLIHAENLGFCYGHEEVLQQVDFEIHAGEFVGILGPNGSGKTTLLRLMLGLLQPHTGSLQVYGKPMQLGMHAEKIGYIPQKVTQRDVQFPITVGEVVMLGLINSRRSQSRTLSEALQLVGLDGFASRQIHELSGGQQQRVYIARALIGQPELMILDEPTVGIDVESQATFYRLLGKLHREHHLTILLVSHDIDVVAQQVSSVLCLNKTVVYHGDPKLFLQSDALAKLYGKHHKFVLHGHA